MKRISKILVCTLLALCFAGIFSACGNKKYKLTVDSEEYLIEKLKKRYSAGESVTVKTEILMDASLTVYLDGEAIAEKTEMQTDGRYTHWEYTFLMPAHDAVLTFEVSGGFGELQP